MTQTALRFFAHVSATTVLRNVPISGTAISIVSPGLSQIGGSVRGPEFDRRAGDDDIAGLERHEGADIGDQIRERLYHAGVVSSCVISPLILTVMCSGLVEIDLVGRHQPRADAAGRIPILALRDVELAVANPVADGALVAQRRAGDMVERLSCAIRRPAAADHQRDLALIVELLGFRRHAESDRWCGPSEPARGRTCWDISERPDRRSRHCGWRN